MRRWGILAIALIAVLVGISLAWAQDGELALTWFSIDAGGGISSDDSRYALFGTIGQPDAGPLTSDGYALSGGFHAGTGGAVASAHAVYLPLVVR
jgi:hypothetical protein